MFRLLSIVLMAMLALPVAAETNRRLPQSAADVHLSYAPLVKQTAPAVVNIYTKKVMKERRFSTLFDDPFFRRFLGDDWPGGQRKRVQNSLGSGVIVAADGLIVTNHHVVEGADEVRVVLSDRREYSAKIVAMQERNDLALLQVDSEGDTLPKLSFGDSNEIFAPLVLGNITEGDIASGRVASLTNPAVTRTTLMKVPTLSTLWDYIYRAMPWSAPKTLSPDEVYALVAYLLNLGYVVDDDFVLSNTNMEETQARMPNRNGMSLDHGLWSVSGAPDVSGSSCTANCNVGTTVTSSLPAYAMNAHGNLAEQVRDWGPYPGIWTEMEGEQLAKATMVVDVPETALSTNGCSGCHQMVGQLVGPGFDSIRARYAGEENGAYLRDKIVNGGAGVWGSMPMPPMSSVGEDALQEIVAWFISGEE